MDSKADERLAIPEISTMNRISNPNTSTTISRPRRPTMPRPKSFAGFKMPSIFGHFKPFVTLRRTNTSSTTSTTSTTHPTTSPTSTITQSISSTITLLNIPQETTSHPLSAYDTTILIDDTYSPLGLSKNGTLSTLKSLLPALLTHQPFGPTLDFLSFRKMPIENITSQLQLSEVLQSVKLRCDNEIIPGEALKNTCGGYISEYKRSLAAGMDRIKPLLVLVLVYSPPSGGGVYDRILRGVQEEMRSSGADEGQMVVLFVQVGGHVGTKKWLERRERMLRLGSGEGLGKSLIRFMGAGELEAKTEQKNGRPEIRRSLSISSRTKKERDGVSGEILLEKVAETIDGLKGSVEVAADNVAHAIKKELYLVKEVIKTHTPVPTSASTTETR